MLFLYRLLNLPGGTNKWTSILPSTFSLNFLVCVCVHAWVCVCACVCLRVSVRKRTVKDADDNRHYVLPFITLQSKWKSAFNSWEKRNCWLLVKHTHLSEPSYFCLLVLCSQHIRQFVCLSVGLAVLNVCFPYPYLSWKAQITVINLLVHSDSSMFCTDFVNAAYLVVVYFHSAKYL